MWKQPVPVAIPELKDNPFAETLFQKIIILCGNETREVRTPKGTIILNRGQCLYGRAFFNEMLGLPAGSQKIEKELKNSPFLNRYVNRCIEHGKGSILKVKDYDHWVSMNRSLNTEQTQNKHRINSNKSIKIAKSVKKNTYVGVCERYIARFNELFQSKYQVTNGRVKQITSRLEVFSEEDILKALKNLSRSEWHVGNNPRGWKADPDFLLRSDEQVDKFLNRKEVIIVE